MSRPVLSRTPGLSPRRAVRATPNRASAGFLGNPRPGRTCPQHTRAGARRPGSLPRRADHRPGSLPPRGTTGLAASGPSRPGPASAEPRRDRMAAAAGRTAPVVVAAAAGAPGPLVATGGPRRDAGRGPTIRRALAWRAVVRRVDAGPRGGPTRGRREVGTWRPRSAGSPERARATGASRSTGGTGAGRQRRRRARALAAPGRARRSGHPGARPARRPAPGSGRAGRRVRRGPRLLGRVDPPRGTRRRARVAAEAAG